MFSNEGLKAALETFYTINNPDKMSEVKVLTDIYESMTDSSEKKDYLADLNNALDIKYGKTLSSVHVNPEGDAVKRTVRKPVVDAFADTLARQVL